MNTEKPIVRSFQLWVLSILAILSSCSLLGYRQRELLRRLPAQIGAVVRNTNINTSACRQYGDHLVMVTTSPSVCGNMSIVCLYEELRCYHNSTLLPSLEPHLQSWRVPEIWMSSYGITGHQLGLALFQRISGPLAELQIIKSTIERNLWGHLGDTKQTWSAGRCLSYPCHGGERGALSLIASVTVYIRAWYLWQERSFFPTQLIFILFNGYKFLNVCLSRLFGSFTPFIWGKCAWPT